DALHDGWYRTGDVGSVDADGWVYLTDRSKEMSEVPVMVTGAFAESDLGVACYHSKLGAVELYLNHLVDGPGEYVVVDMTAGADAFASGLFTRFDMTFLVVEPTRKSLSVYRQYRDHAAEFGIPVAVVGNKVTSPFSSAIRSSRRVAMPWRDCRGCGESAARSMRGSRSVSRMSSRTARTIASLLGKCR
ncbi:hypothetical protein ABZ372_38030, partial [Streptomyces sp. NPDC005921]